MDERVILEKGRCIVPRSIYKQVKNMNREGLERFLADLMMQGVEEGISEVGGAKSINTSNLINDIASILQVNFGIGAKRFALVTDELIKAINDNTVIVDSEDLTFKIKRGDNDGEVERS